MRFLIAGSSPGADYNWSATIRRKVKTYFAPEHLARRKVTTYFAPELLI
jgi:hypothetical protein